MRIRVLIVALVVVGGLAAITASWLFARPEQDAIAEVLHQPVGRPGEPFYGFVWLFTGGVLAWLRPRNGIGWVLVAVGGCQVVQQVAVGYGSLGVFASPDWPAARWVALVASVLWIPGYLPLANVLPALYPRGRLPGPRWGWPVAGALLGTAVLMVLALLTPEVYDDGAPGPSPMAWVDPPHWLSLLLTALGAGLLVGCTVLIWVMSVVRLVRSRPPERQQLAWLLVVIVPMFATSVSSVPGWVSAVLNCLLPVAIAIGVFRYHLLGIELVIRRGLVYGVLTALILASYLLTAELVGSGTHLGSLSAAGTAAVVAVVLAPLRERLQRGVDQVLYGERQDPVRAVSRLGQQVAGTDGPDLLRSVLTSIATAVHAPGAAVVSPQNQVRCAVGAPGPGPALQLTVGSRPLGTLQVASRRPGERYGPADLRLLDLLAPQLAVLVYALDLADALEAERDRVLTATRAERDRLRRDLHDGLGPSLSGVRLGLVAASDALAAADTAVAESLLTRLLSELADAVSEVRRIIDGLRPASLDHNGLVPAVQQQLSAAGVPAELVVGDLAPIGLEVETAALRIAAEALTNVGKHAHASHVTVRLETLGHELRLTVADDGRGLHLPVRSGGSVSVPAGGEGLASMRHRAEALGGSLDIDSEGTGTKVTALLPIAASGRHT